jgi:N-acetylmuramic acid 6-phosphate (MurNAc-6-P) etherase
MVDLRTANEKLQKCSEAMLMQLTGVNQDDARDALSRAHGNVEIAVMVLNGCVTPG